MTTKQLHNQWTRSASLFTIAIQQLEKEIISMRERKVNQEFIDKKDNQVEMLVDFFNQTDELLQAYRLALANAQIENHFLTEMLYQKISLPDLIAYKPSAHLIIANLETLQSQTLTTTNP